MDKNSERFFEGLNPQQVEAVKYTEGPLLIMAGAGSGKTKVLTHKIAYLHNEFNVPLANILAVTFTNKAAAEMKARVHDLLELKGGRVQDNWILTFHSFGFKILKMYSDKLGYDKNFVVYDSGDQLTLIKQILADFEIDTEQFKPKSIQYQISKSKNSFVFPEQFLQKADTNILQVAAKVYAEYQLRLRQNNAMDFDDLLLNMVILLKQEKEILDKYQNKFEFILIDEYQDINMPQYHISYMLSAKHRRIFVVGDTDQNIYSWRGANLQNILNFEKDFPDAKVILLEQNYRSTSTILDIANSVIVNNKLRKKKSLWTNQEKGDEALFFIAQNDYDEAENAVKKVKAVIEKGSTLSEIAFLYRTNAMSRVIETILLQHNIKYRVYGGLRFYDRKEIKDIMAYLKLILNYRDDIAFQRVVNVPSRKIGKLTLLKVQEKALEKEISCFEAVDQLEEVRGHAALLNFKELILSFQQEYLEGKLSAAELIDIVINRTGYKEMLQAESNLEAKTRIENLEELKKSATEQNYSLDDFVSMSTLLTSQDESGEVEDVLTLMTMHTAKGLEYDNIFLFGLEEGVLPHVQSLDAPDELEEERRLCYVAVTRARKRLFLSASSNRGAYGSTTPKELSRFFYEMPAELLKVEFSDRLSGFNHIIEKLSAKPEYNLTKPDRKGTFFTRDYEEESKAKKVLSYSVGDIVNSGAFGEGTVVQVFGSGKDTSLQIRFGKEMKLVMPKYGKLEKI